MLDGCSNFEFHMSIKTSNGRIDANTMFLQFLLSKECVAYVHLCLVYIISALFYFLFSKPEAGFY